MEIEDSKIELQKVPIIYSSRYNITAFGLEELHPFDSKKYGRIFQELIESKLVNPDQIVTPCPLIPDLQDLLYVHSRKYLAKLHCTVSLTFILEVPPLIFLPSWLVRKRVLEPMQIQTSGTIMAGKLALSTGWAINLGGGFHHCSANSGGGFCPYADITLAIRHLRREYPDKIKKAMIVDLDAHQGNGHERDFIDDKDTYIMDIYNHQIYPDDEYAKKGISREIKVSSYVNDESYLESLNYFLDNSLNVFHPDILIYNAGTDCMSGDPLGKMNLSTEGIKKRDLIVFKMSISRSIPIVMVLSGGYQKSNAPCIAKSIINLDNELGLIKLAKSNLLKINKYI